MLGTAFPVSPEHPRQLVDQVIQRLSLLSACTLRDHEVAPIQMQDSLRLCASPLFAKDEVGSGKVWVIFLQLAQRLLGMRSDLGGNLDVPSCDLNSHGPSSLKGSLLATTGAPYRQYDTTSSIKI